jgi:hypothetical protein
MFMNDIDATYPTAMFAIIHRPFMIHVFYGNRSARKSTSAVGSRLAYPFVCRTTHEVHIESAFDNRNASAFCPNQDRGGSFSLRLK